LDNKNQFLTEILSHKRKAKESIANLILGLIGEMNEAVLQKNGRKKKQPKYSASSQLNRLPKNIVQQLLTHIASRKLSKINPMKKIVDTIHPDLFNDIIQ
jgi:hypothetical protein